jgi:putative membrane protein
MDQTSRESLAGSPATADWADRATYGAIVALGAILFWLSYEHPSLMPFWAPWDFSPTFYLAASLSLYWFWRGIALMPAAERPPIWRRIFFLAGLLLIYGVLQTRYEYLSQHMFFLNRLQNLAMHDVGPFFIALAWPGATIKRGMPAWLQRTTENRLVGKTIRFLHRPPVAAAIFVGFVYLWLVPAVHFRAMIDHRLYAVMNWSMVLGGLLFWCLVLDPRPKPPAPASYGMRAALSFGVMFPQVLLGAVISLTSSDLYPYYDLCGRLFPSIDALNDQHIGGIIAWIPPGMMSVIGVLLVLNFMRLHEEAEEEMEDEAARSVALLASRWTGR